MSVPVQIATVADHVAGDVFTAAMWTSLEDNINQGIVEQVGVMVKRTTNQAVATASTVTLSFDTDVQDVYGMWALASPTQLVAPVGGWYDVGVQVTWAATSGGGGPFEVRFVQNGTAQVVASTGIQSDGTHATQQQHSCKLYCSVGDVITITVLQRTGASLNVTGATATLVRV